MRKERMGHTWQPTVLVNELYLELLKVKSLAGGESAEHEKQAFFRLSAFLMRRLLISHSRALSRRIEKVELDDEIDVAASGAESLANIEKLLAKLEAVDPRLRHVVELRVFQGYTVEEIAAHLDCSAKTVTRCWTFAQRWLRNALGVSP